MRVTSPPRAGQGLGYIDRQTTSFGTGGPMLELTKADFDKMQAQQQDHFVDSALPSLRREFPELWLRFSEPDLARWLRRQADAAGPLGLLTFDGAYRLIGWRLRLGADFPAGPDFAWAREILQREAWPEARRLDAIDQVLWGQAPEASA